MAVRNLLFNFGDFYTEVSYRKRRNDGVKKKKGVGAGREEGI